MPSAPGGKNDRKAYCLINASVSVTVIRSVPAKLAAYDASASTACSFALLEYLKRAYSSGSGPPKTELWMTVFRSDLDEGADPVPFMARLKGAFEDILASGTQVPDEVLSYAILGHLPPSFSIVAQTIYMQDKPSSSSVLAAVRTEWRRRETSAQRVTAPLDQGKPPSGQLGQLGELAKLAEISKLASAQIQAAKQSAYNPDAYCENHKFYGHWTKDCRGVRRPQHQAAVNAHAVRSAHLGKLAVPRRP